MAQRLKKKLDNMGVDPSNSKLMENFCLIGTPLPSLANSKDANEFVPVWKQEVRDEQGRRRLHGAFTGGFSAGYFNTVGSKEGWTPSTFKSSRANRASQKASRPEDFMDDEDLAELRDSQKLVDTTEPSHPAPSDSNDITSALQSLTLPASDSPGAQLLRKMGWKPGQGIGPRVSYTRRRQQDIEAGAVKEGAPEDPEAEKHLFAPRDTPVLLFRPKENAHGLGHVGPVRLGGEAVGGKEKEGPNISTGFGLGALNDADDDDIDVYDPGAIARTTRMAFDEADDADTDGHSRRRPLTLSNQPQTQSSTISHTGGRFTGPSGKFNSGRPVLAGFVLSEAPVGQDEWLPLPDVPTGWVPDPRRVWETPSGEEAKEEKGAGKASETQAQDGKGGWKKAPTAQEASEPTLPQPKKSVFDYLSQKDRDRLQNFRKTPGDAPPAPPKPAVKPRIAPTTAPTAKAALLGFQPFTSDPLRQARYTAYLQHFASPVSTLDPPGLGLLPDQNAEQFNREMEDYAKAAAIFKPVSGAMAGRFVGASGGSVVVGGPTVGEGGLYQPTFDKQDQDSTQSTITIPIEEQDPKKNAARHGMYGPLTHDVQPWYPHRLLCKRFGVRDPHPDGPPTAAAKTWEEQVGVAPTAPPATVDLADVEMRPLDAEGEGEEEGEDLGPRDLSNVGLGEDPHQGVDTLTYVRPAMDVFKAIFASDEEDSEDEDQGAKMKPEDAPVSVLDAALRPANNGPDGPADLATFKPVFNVRTKAKDKDKGEGKEKKKKKDRNKRAVLSFDVDEGADGEPETIAAKSKSKRRERDKDADRALKKARTEDDGEGDWIEKPPPASVSGAGGSAPVGGIANPEAGGGLPSAERGSARTRKRAIDFM